MSLRPRTRAIVILNLAIGLCGLAGCTNNYGVDIRNSTGQDLLVEFLDVASDGSTRVYSTATLGTKGSFTNKVATDDQGFGKRVRFSLPERSESDLSAHVELKLASDRLRSYDLVLNNGKLVADEYAKGRYPTDIAERSGGD